MCVLWQSDLRGLVAFFFYLPRFCWVIKRGGQCGQEKCAYPHGLVHSLKYQTKKQKNYLLTIISMQRTSWLLQPGRSLTQRMVASSPPERGLLPSLPSS